MVRPSRLIPLLLAFVCVAACECTNEECDSACSKMRSCASVSFPAGDPCLSCNMFELSPDDPGVKCASCVLAKTCETMVADCQTDCTEAGEKWGTTPSDDDDWDD